MKEQLIFDPSVTGFKDEHDRVGAHLVDANGDVLTTGDGDSDNVANAMKALDTRAFAFAYDAVGDNWDRLKSTAGALHVDIQDSELSVNIEGDYAEDSAHASGDRGLFNLSIRMSDLTADNSALLAGSEGDYQGTFTNDKGELYVKDSDVLAKLNSGVTVSDGGGSITVDAADLDIRDLAFATDSVDVSGSEVSLDAATLAALETITVNQGTDPWVIGDGGGSITVDAADLDIRDLAAATDSVTSYLKDGNGDDIQAYNAELRVTDIISTIANSALVDIGTGAGSGPGAQAIKASAALANRKWAWLYNNSKKKMFVGASGITASSGFPFPPGSMYEFRLGAAAVMHVLGTDAADGQDLRLMEGAA